MLRRRSRLRLAAKSRDQHALIDNLRTGEIVLHSTKDSCIETAWADRRSAVVEFPGGFIAEIHSSLPNISQHVR
jgi:hypothetical protein